MTRSQAATDDPIAIRVPLILRVCAVVFICVWCGLVLAAARKSVGHSLPGTVIPLVMLVFGATVGYRLVRLSVTCYPDYLLVRNRIRTRRIARSEIEGFRVGAAGSQPFSGTIYALLRDSSVVPLDVAGRVTLLRRGQTALEERRALLQSWLDDSHGQTPTQ